MLEFARGVRALPVFDHDTKLKLDKELGGFAFFLELPFRVA